MQLTKLVSTASSLAASAMYTAPAYLEVTFVMRTELSTTCVSMLMERTAEPGPPGKKQSRMSSPVRCRCL